MIPGSDVSLGSLLGLTASPGFFAACFSLAPALCAPALCAPTFRGGKTVVRGIVERRPNGSQPIQTACSGLAADRHLHSQPQQFRSRLHAEL